MHQYIDVSLQPYCMSMTVIVVHHLHCKQVPLGVAAFLLSLCYCTHNYSQLKTALEESREAEK